MCQRWECHSFYPAFFATVVSKSTLKLRNVVVPRWTRGPLLWITFPNVIVFRTQLWHALLGFFPRGSCCGFDLWCDSARGPFCSVSPWGWRVLAVARRGWAPRSSLPGTQRAFSSLHPGSKWFFSRATCILMHFKTKKLSNLALW